MKTLILILLFPVFLIGQSKMDKFEYGLSLGALVWSDFQSLNESNSFSHNFYKSTSIYPVVDLVAKYQLNSKYILAFDISNMRKENETSGGIPYKMTYLTASPLIGLAIDKKNKYYVSLGPYFGYLINAKKGNYNIDDNSLNSFDYGVEMLINYIDRNATKHNIFGFETIKFQVGFGKVLFFKTMSISASMIGIKF